MPMPPSASPSFGLASQHRRKLRARRDEVAAIERRKAIGDRAAARIDGSVLLGAFAGGFILLHHRIEARFYRGVVRRELQVGLIQRGVGGAGVEPQQRLAPALARGGAHRAVARELRELGDALAARHVAIGQVLGVSECKTRVVRILLRELLQARGVPGPSLAA